MLRRPERGAIPHGFDYIGELCVDELQPNDFIEGVDDTGARGYWRGYVREIGPPRRNKRIQLVCEGLDGRTFTLERSAHTRIDTFRTRPKGTN